MKRNNLVISLGFLFLVFVVVFLFGVIRTYSYLENSKYIPSGQNIIKIAGKDIVYYLIQDNSQKTSKVLAFTYNDNSKDNLPLMLSDTSVSVDTKPDSDQVSYFLDSILQGKYVKSDYYSRIDLYRTYIDRAYNSDRNFDLLKQRSSEENSTQVTSDQIDYLIDKNALREGLTISIVNGTDVNGLASSIGNLLDSMGYNVVAVSNSSDLINKTVIVINKESYTSSRLRNFFRTEPVIDEKFGGISDIEVVLGQDLVENNVL